VDHQKDGMEIHFQSKLSNYMLIVKFVTEVFKKVFADQSYFTQCGKTIDLKGFQ